MIKIEIALYIPDKAITLYVKKKEKDIKEAVYSRLTQYGIDEERAIECASWCELAIIGEGYYEDDFDVFICDGE